MPIYEYVCRDCGEELEQLQRLSDDPLTDCPACGHSTLKRKISAAGFRLAGGGWYETDFKSDGKRNLAGREDKSTGTSDKSDSKASADTTASKSDKPSGDTTKSSPKGADSTASKKSESKQTPGSSGTNA